MSEYPKVMAGMLAPGFSIGKYTLRDGRAEGKVWIEKGTGEGGDFDAEELESLIGHFYEERF